jgi:methylmalonyl-CoA mutase
MPTSDSAGPGTEALNLAAEFPPVTKEEWEAVIQADLKGADYEKKLVWKTEEGISVRPYYMAEDVTPLDLAPGQFPFTRGEGQKWEIAQNAPIAASAIRADLWHERGATAVQELAYAIAEGVDRIAASGTGAGNGLTICFGIGSNYFFEIAKLRAARVLWAQAVAAFDDKAAEAAVVKIHAVTALSNKSIYDPYTNLLRATTEALSAAIGGANAITVQTARFSDRLARNIQLILKEEAHLDKVADPAGGAYYVEALTDALARDAWKLFQQIEAGGGFAKALASGSVDKAVAESRAAKEKSFASRRKVMVGVNNYPDVGESALEDAQALASAEWRLAGAIEKIRLRTEVHAKEAGKRPRVLLLKRGDLKMKMARATFVLNFFGCGGFEMVESEELDPAADIIVLCSSDPEYLELAKDVCSKTKAPVIVAGNPKEQIEELRAAGVAGFVHVLSNAVDTLTEWQDKLGMAPVKGGKQ